MSSVLTCPSCGRRSRVSPTAAGVPRCPACKTVLPWVVPAGSADFAAETAAAVPVLVDFWAPWCGPCRAVAPVLESLARDRAGQLKVVKVNVDEAPDLARRFEAASIPTLLLLRDGREVERVVGALPRPQLEARIAPHLGVGA